MRRSTKVADDPFPPGLPAPALRALAAAGYTRLGQLTRVSEASLLALHGFGPKGIRIVRAALQASGRDLASGTTAPRRRAAGATPSSAATSVKSKPPAARPDVARKPTTSTAATDAPREHIHRHNDGTIWGKGTLLGDVMHGEWEWFRKDGTKMRSGSFDHGVQVGEWTTYDRDGRVVKVTRMKPKQG